MIFYLQRMTGQSQLTSLLVRDWHRMPQKWSFLCLASCAGNLHLHRWQRFSRADLRRDCDHARPALRKCVTTCHDWEKCVFWANFFGPPSGGSSICGTKWYQAKSSWKTWKLEASWSFTDVDKTTLHFLKAHQTLAVTTVDTPNLAGFRS